MPARILRSVRRADSITIAVLTILFCQLALGTAYAVLKAQTRNQQQQSIDQAIENERMRGATMSLDGRVTSIERLRLDARLSVLEGMAERLSKIESLMFGTVITLLGNLALAIFQIREQKARRQRLIES